MRASPTELNALILNGIEFPFGIPMDKIIGREFKTLKRQRIADVRSIYYEKWEKGL